MEPAAIFEHVPGFFRQKFTICRILKPLARVLQMQLRQEINKPLRRNYIFPFFIETLTNLLYSSLKTADDIC